MSRSKSSNSLKKRIAGDKSGAGRRSEKNSNDLILSMGLLPTLVFYIGFAKGLFRMSMCAFSVFMMVLLSYCCLFFICRLYDPLSEVHLFLVFEK